MIIDHQHKMLISNGNKKILVAFIKISEQKTLITVKFTVYFYKNILNVMMCLYYIYAKITPHFSKKQWLDEGKVKNNLIFSTTL